MADRSRPERSWQDILDELGVRPRKSRGQNFLHDRMIAQRIVEVASLTKDDLVVEVGPGLGTLTRPLVEQAGRVIAVEVDSRLAKHLRESLLEPNLTIIEADILAVDIGAIVHNSDYFVVANLPYSIAPAVLQHFFSSSKRPKRLVVMVQREVAERMTARPPRMSILAVAIQFYGRPRIAFRVGSGAFVPPPRVESAVVRIDTNEVLPLPAEEIPEFFRLVRAGFSQRRKLLRNALADGLGIDRSAVDSQIKASGIDLSRRAETLTVEEWIELYQTIRDDLRANH